MPDADNPLIFEQPRRAEYDPVTRETVYVPLEGTGTYDVARRDTEAEIGQVQKEGDVWLAFLPGGPRVDGAFDTRQAAGQALLDVAVRADG
jgi:hypothetical protein